MKNSIVSKSRILIGITFLFILMAVSNNCKKSASDMTGTTGNTGGTGGTGANAVTIQGMSFTPSTISVAAGTMVTWTNKDAVAHTVTSSTGAFDSGNIPSNGTWSFTFASAGTYNYVCSIHSGMTGKVVVN